ncbi:hypothetical protein AB0D54_21235 [Streptomyces xanthophaeus]|uniref:hypothetical protein n=1 Tax=Streptomyces xanthophaeus TaxID=67385 RepID=UPI00341C22C8
MTAADSLERALGAPGGPALRPLPPVVATLLRTLAAPPRLAAHLRLVHDVAHELTDWAAGYAPGLAVDREAVLFGSPPRPVPRSGRPTSRWTRCSNGSPRARTDGWASRPSSVCREG